MGVYIVGTSLSVLFAYLATHINDEKKLGSINRKFFKKFFMFISFLPLTIIMAFRYNVGTDYFSYRRIFIQGTAHIEMGYSVLMNIAKFISDDPQSIFVLSAIIICGCYYYIIYKESINPVYSILLFVISKDYFSSMNGMRQYIATAIMMLAIPYIKNNSLIKFIAVFVIAFSIHKSVVVFVFLYFIMKIEIHPMVGIISIVATYSGSLLIRRIIYFILQKLNFYNNYFSSDFYGNSSGNFDYRTMIIFACFFILLSYEYYYIKEYKELKLMYSSVWLSLLIISLSAVMPTNIYRLTHHLNASVILYTPLALYNIQNKKLKMLLYFCITCSFLIVTMVELANGFDEVIPYHSIYDQIEMF